MRVLAFYEVLAFALSLIKGIHSRLVFVPIYFDGVGDGRPHGIKRKSHA